MFELLGTILYVKRLETLGTFIFKATFLPAHAVCQACRPSTLFAPLYGVVMISSWREYETIQPTKLVLLTKMR